MGETNIEVLGISISLIITLLDFVHDTKLDSNAKREDLSLIS